MFLQFLVGATGIPITRILGTSVAGWSTGDNELTQYYDLIAQKQNKDLRYQLRIIDEIIERSLFGKKMNIGYKFLPKKELSEKEDSDLRRTNAETFQMYVNMRVMTPQIVAQNLKDEYTSMTDEYIETIEDDFFDIDSMNLKDVAEEDNKKERVS